MSNPDTNELDEILKKFDVRGPLLSTEDMDKIESRWEEDRRNRRMALVLLTIPTAELREKVREDRGFASAVAAIFRYCEEGADFYKGVHELMEQVEVTSMITLCEREDMKEVLAEVDAEAAA